MARETTDGWAADEMGQADLEDQRLNARLVSLCDRFSEAPECGIGDSIGVGRVFIDPTARSPTTRGPAGARRRARRPAAASRWPSGPRFPWAPGLSGNRSDAPGE